MRIAVTYKDGKVFEHFGHSEKFKIYDAEGEDIISSQIIDVEGAGHGALARVLASNNVDVLICGGIGPGAQNAIEEMGIELCAGQSGDVDKIVELYLMGGLINSGVNCDHHGEGHSCGEAGCGVDGCGGDEGGCHSSGGCGGCHAKPSFEGKNVGKTVRAHYRGTYNDGTQFDSSYDRGEPLEFVCGAGMMIKGFDRAVANMNVGDIVDVHLLPSEAYGDKDPNAIFDVPLEQLPGAESLEIGQRVYLTNMMGQPFPVEVVKKDEISITFDANHEMAGKELNFKIELVEVL